MAGKGKIVRGALKGLSDLVSPDLPENIRDLPSFKEATRAYKKGEIDEFEGYETGEFKYDDAELDAEEIFVSNLGPGDDLNLIRYDESGYGGALRDWYDGKIELEELAEKGNFAGVGSEYLPPSNYKIDPMSYIIRDLELSYNMSKDDIIKYFDMNNALPEDFHSKAKRVGRAAQEQHWPTPDFNLKAKPTPTPDFDDREMQMLRDAFASNDPDNPIVKRVRGALADLVDDDALVEITPEMIYGKSN